jgi:hypothetical protein
MNARNALARIGSFLNMVGSAVAVSYAVELQRIPRARDLRTLGIDPTSFGKIRY